MVVYFVLYRDTKSPHDIVVITSSNVREVCALHTVLYGNNLQLSIAELSLRSVASDGFVLRAVYEGSTRRRWCVAQ
jgi:hypothetical protein